MIRIGHVLLCSILLEAAFLKFFFKEAAKPVSGMYINDKKSMHVSAESLHKTAIGARYQSVTLSAILYTES